MPWRHTGKCIHEHSHCKCIRMDFGFTKELPKPSPYNTIQYTHLSLSFLYHIPATFKIQVSLGASLLYTLARYHCKCIRMDFGFTNNLTKPIQHNTTHPSLYFSIRSPRHSKSTSHSEPPLQTATPWRHTGARTGTAVETWRLGESVQVPHGQLPL